MSTIGVEEGFQKNNSYKNEKQIFNRISKTKHTTIIFVLRRNLSPMTCYRVSREKKYYKKKKKFTIFSKVI